MNASTSISPQAMLNRGVRTLGGFQVVQSRLFTCSNQKSRHSTKSP
jgi:hypothetical protein